MNTIRLLIRPSVHLVAALAAFGLVARLASADTVNAVWNSATDVPVTATGYTAAGNTVNFTLNLAPTPGRDLMVVNNTGLAFISGTFDNLAQGAAVGLSYGGATFHYAANYYGGSGNDLVLAWANNSPFAWGYNDRAQLGNNTQDSQPSPVPVTTTGVLAGKTIVALAAGGEHSLALCSDGTLAGWGRNDYGQVGDNSTTTRLTPVAVNRASGVSALYGKTVVAIAAGAFHSLALCSDGTAAAWGYNGDGELGDGTGLSRLAPVAVKQTSGSALYGKTMVALAGGCVHSLALCSDGKVAAWGLGDAGQLGIGGPAYNPCLTPVAVSTSTALSGKTVTAIVAAHVHSLALCSDGTVAGWGGNSSGQLGDNTTTVRYSPVAVNTNAGLSALYGKTVVAVAAGYTHSLALCSDGTVAAWGQNDAGQLGDNTATRQLVPVAAAADPGVSALYGKCAVGIAAGTKHSLALCSDGTLAAWGYNGDGQLGDSTTSNRLAAVLVNTTSLAAGQRFFRVFSSTEAQHSLAIVAAGPPPCDITLPCPQTLSDGSLQFAFTNTPGVLFSLLAATNPALPSSNWSVLGSLTEVSPGQYQFTDPQATNTLQRFYRIRSP